MSFYYEIDKEKQIFPARSTVCVEFARSLHVCVSFLDTLVSSYILKMFMWDLGV